MGKIIAIISGNDGVGKTTVAANMSSCMAILKYKTLCVDFGTGSNKIRNALGMSNKRHTGGIKPFNGQGWVIDACSSHSGKPNLFILTMTEFSNPDEKNIADIKHMFSDIRQNFDYCIIDTPSISDAAFTLSIADADMSIIVATCESLVISDVLPAVKASQKSGIKNFDLLVNRIPADNNERVKGTADIVTGATGTRLIGLIPEEESISQTRDSKNPRTIHSKRIFTHRFLSVARGIVSEFEASIPPVPTSQRSIPLAPLPQLSIPPIPTPQPPKTPIPPPPPLIKQLPLTESKKPLSPSQENVDDSQTLDGDDDIPYDIPSNLVGSFGDPKLWAKSTLKHADIEDLIEVYAVVQGPFITQESIRKRMWIHDLLDDVGVPYYIEVGSKSGSKDLVEAQRIYVEEKNAGKALVLIKQYNDPDNISRYKPEEDEQLIISEDGMPQVMCLSCGEKIDFDYNICPYCKGKIDR